MQHKHLWYTRRGEEVRGPFPVGLVTRYLLLGRILAEDELSTDRITWQRADSVWEIKADAMRQSTGGGMDSPRLEAARRWEDERRGFDRRAAQSPEIEKLHRDKRRGIERRGKESEEQIRHRLSSYQARKSFGPKQAYTPMRVLVVVLLGIAIAALMYLVPRGELPVHVRCDALPQPQVNWSNCALEGVQLEGVDLTAGQLRSTNLTGANLRGAVLAGGNLAYSNLSFANLGYANLARANLMGANLRSADLSSSNLEDANMSYTDLTGANLGGAELANTKFDHAIWLDGSLCAPNSIGQCLGAP